MITDLKEYSIESWVEEAPDDANREFREAVHTILSAIAADKNLKESMVLKGGILLAIRYKSNRYTKDMDFSTEKVLGEGIISSEEMRESLNNSFATVVEDLEYDLDCRVQRCKIEPSEDPSYTYKSINMTIGYAYKGSPRHKWLLKSKSPKTVSIDFSLNESTPNIESLKLQDGDVLVYSLTDLIAEKYRSLLQQIDRNRGRRQDIYDLNFLIDKLDDIDEEEKFNILKCLIQKANSRKINPGISSFDNKEIKSRAKEGYHTLKDEVDGDLPDFDEIYETVSDFYRSLPWETVSAEETKL